MQTKLVAVFAAILAAVENWKPNTNLTNNLQDAVIAFNTLEQIDPNLLPAAAVKDVEATAAGMANLSNGQAALIGTVPAGFNGENDKVMVIAVRQYVGGNVPAGSPAETIKKLLGT